MTEPSRVVCPSCSEGGIECAGPKKVPKITLHSLVRPEHHDALPADPTYFCSDKDCETVYFDAGGRQITKDQLLVQVWQKEDTGDIPICYCFDFSARDIMEDARENTPPTIPLTIRDKVKAGLCACDVKNPQGSCCLGNVAYWVKQAS